MWQWLASSGSNMSHREASQSSQQQASDTGDYKSSRKVYNHKPS